MRNPKRHGDDQPVPRIMMLKSDCEAALAAKDKWWKQEVVGPLMSFCKNTVFGRRDVLCMAAYVIAAVEKKMKELP